MRNRIASTPSKIGAAPDSKISQVRKSLPQVLFVTPYPPADCPIANYTHELLTGFKNKFENSFKLKVCALEHDSHMHQYPKEVKFILKTQHCTAFRSLSGIINSDKKIEIVVVQHEFSFFQNCQAEFSEMLKQIDKTKIIAFHSVLPDSAEYPDSYIADLTALCDAVIVPTQSAKDTLTDKYGIFADKITVLESTIQLNNVDHLVLQGYQNVVARAREEYVTKYAVLFQKFAAGNITLDHRLPHIKLGSIKKLTSEFGLRRFTAQTSDSHNLYTLDDNANALIAICEHFDITQKEKDVLLMNTYLNFIGYCQQADGTFLNFVDGHHNFPIANTECNLDDANGKAVWALGTLIAISQHLPANMVTKAETIIERVMPNLEQVNSPRAIAFIVKGLFHYNKIHDSKAVRLLIKRKADKLAQMYFRESSVEWQWFEKHLMYSNGFLPEAMLLAYLETSETTYEEIAIKTVDFLMSSLTDQTKIEYADDEQNRISANEISNPADIAYTIVALYTFYDVYKDPSYFRKLQHVFDWFLKQKNFKEVNHSLKSAKTDEVSHDGAETTISNLLARLSIEKAKAAHTRRQSKIFKLKLENYAFKA